jgi:hypothetical protein
MFKLQENYFKRSSEFFYNLVENLKTLQRIITGTRSCSLYFLAELRHAALDEALYLF